MTTSRVSFGDSCDDFTFTDGFEDFENDELDSNTSTMGANTMNSYEIINMIDLENKYGSGSDIIDALFSRAGKECNNNNKPETDYSLMNEFEKHLMMIQDSDNLTEKQDSTSESTNRPNKTSTLSPTPEVNNQPLEKKLKSNSYDTSIPNVLTCKQRLEASAKTQHHEPHQNIWSQRYIELEISEKSVGSATVSTIDPPNPSLGMSLETERHSNKKYQNENSSILKKSRIQVLKKNEFRSEDRRNQSWERAYEELVSFMNKFGHAKIPRDFSQNPALELWVHNQRRLYKKYVKGGTSSNMTEHRIQLFHKIGGFEWDCRNGNLWDRSYAELVSFVKEFGHARVPQKFPLNPSLGGWVANQRQHYKNYLKGDPSLNMTESRIQLLNKVGFEWDYHRNPWDKSYAELVNFVKRFGHARVPQQFPLNPPLGMWVANQRKRYKKYLKGDTSSIIIKNHIQLLNEIGFEWECHTSQPWDRSYKELVTFLKEFGHARIPLKFPLNPTLGIWVKTQRKGYKKYLKGDASSNMTEDRIRLLHKVGGFEWDCRNDKPWIRSYDELGTFVKEFGHARIPRKYPKNPSLGMWVDTQRRNYRNYLKGDASAKMTAERIQLLEKVGFEWLIKTRLRVKNL